MLVAREVLKKWMQIASIDTDSTFGLVDPETKKGKLKLLLKYILRQFSSENAKGCDNGGSSWYTKLHDHLD